MTSKTTSTQASTRTLSNTLTAHPTRQKRSHHVLRNLVFTVTTFVATLFPLSIAVAAEFREHAMCVTSSPDAAFPRISVQTDPTNSKRGILILVASDGWTQVYSGPLRQDTKSIIFKEDRGTVGAIFNKDVFTATITFNNDSYVCDERSFGQ